MKRLLVLGLSLLSILAYAEPKPHYIWNQAPASYETLWLGFGADYARVDAENATFDPFLIHVRADYFSHQNWRHQIYAATGLGEEQENDAALNYELGFGYLLGFSERLDNQLLATASVGIGAQRVEIREQTGAKTKQYQGAFIWKFSLEEPIQALPGWRGYMEAGTYCECEENRTVHYSIGIKRAFN